MNNKLYAVVYFSKEEMYSEIPTEWLLDDKSCWWPKSINAKKFMEKKCQPNPDSWDIHSIQIEGYSSTLDGARKKAAHSDYSTSNEIEMGRGKRKKLTFSKCSEESSSEDELKVTPPPSPEPSTSYLMMANPQDSPKTLSAEIDMDTPIIFLDERINPPPSTDNSSPHDQEKNLEDDNHCQKETIEAEGEQISLATLYQEIVKLKAICISNKKYINKIHQKLQLIEHGHNVDIGRIPKLKIPLKSEEDIEIFDKDMDKEDTKNELVTFIASVGGRDAKDHTNRCLKSIFTNELATRCSWLGQRNNRRIKNTKVAEILIETIISRYASITQEDMEKYIGEWFRLSRQRLNRENKMIDH